MKRILIFLALLAPALGLAYFTLQPQADQNVSLPIFHFYLVTFTTFAAAVISILLTVSLGLNGQPRHVLTAAAFAVIGSVFFSHGLATPSALIDHTHPAISWSAWLTLFGGGVLFAIAALDGPNGMPKWIPVRGVIYAAVALVLLYSGIAAFAPDVLTSIDDKVAPLHADTVFVITLLLWGFAALRLWQTWRVTHNRVDGALAFVAFWLGTATVSMHRFPIWNLSWWLYHVTLLVAFIAIAIMLLLQYEQLRQFKLSRYFLAVSLIVTALLALAASALFTQYSYDTLVTEVRNTASNTASSIANGLATDLADYTKTPSVFKISLRVDIDQLLQPRIQNLPIEGIYLYTLNKKLEYPLSYDDTGTVVVMDATGFTNASNGTTTSLIRPPSAAPSGYSASAGVHIVETYAPLRAKGSADGEVIGVLVTIQAAPSLDKALINARITGLLIGTLTMGLLFIALLSVVLRGDSIITVRTDELRRVSAQLKTYSEWLLGADLLGRVLSDPNALSLTRRERTVMFVDIRNFTGWSEQRTPEEVVAMLNRYYTVAEAIAKQHNVIKLKFAADEVMGVFPDAGRAAATALGLRTEFARMLDEYNLGAGIGLNTGRLVEGLLGSKDVKVYDVIGDTVNTAKRIEGAAVRAEVLVSETTFQALGETASFGPERQIEAKGKNAPVTVYPLLGQK